MGPDGLEPSPGRLKVCCAAVTPRPRQGMWIGLCRVCRCFTPAVRIIFVVLFNRLEWSRTTASALSERRASVTPPSVFTFLFQSVGTVGIEPTLSCSQDTRAPGALHPETLSLAFAENSRRLHINLIRRSGDHQTAGGAPVVDRLLSSILFFTCSPAPMFSCSIRQGRIGPYGSRTHLSALKGRYPPTDRRTSPLRTPSASGSGGARILVSWFSARC
jgi:hypothetical protein